MPVTTEMKEILSYFSGRDDYAIFGGFASMLHVGLETSEDIDVFIYSRETANKVYEDLLQRGWNEKAKVEDKWVWYVGMEKNGTSFDMHHSELSNKVFLNNTVEMRFDKYPLSIVGTEELFIAKIHALIDDDRSPEKVQRDKKVISLLKDKIDGEKMRLIFDKLPEEFWTKGYF